MGALRRRSRYDEAMTTSRAHLKRNILVVLLVIASLVVIGVAVVLVPILSHKSAGGSGQELPESFVAEVHATGADGRTRTLEVTAGNGESFDPAAVRPGESLAVSGTGFNAEIGIYIAICAIPADATVKPGPCLGGVPAEAAGGTSSESAAASPASVWVSNDWAWRAFATGRYDDPAAGSFHVTLTVPPASHESLNCEITRCAITTRADHTAAQDRVQDLMIPIQFAR